MIFRSDGVLFDSTFAEMDAAGRARHHIRIISLQFCSIFTVGIWNDWANG